MANPDSDSHNPIFDSPIHLSESEMRFESKESTPNSGFFGFNFNRDSDSPFLYPFHRATHNAPWEFIMASNRSNSTGMCCLSLFSNKHFCGKEIKLVLVKLARHSFIQSMKVT